MLHFCVADTFLRRLFGLHALGRRERDMGLILVPCRGIHTFFLDRAIDVVFLNAQGQELKRIAALSPWRFAQGPKGTRIVVELPAGQCGADPEYLAQIRAALARVGADQSRERNTLT